MAKSSISILLKCKVKEVDVIISFVYGIPSKQLLPPFKVCFKEFIFLSNLKGEKPAICLYRESEAP
jgi:hypothetical protein